MSSIPKYLSERDRELWEQDQSGCQINQSSLRQLIHEQGYRCAMTGRELTPETARLDHKVSLSEGGGHTLDNAWWVHQDVNDAKGTMGQKEFVALCCEVASHSLLCNG